MRQQNIAREVSVRTSLATALLVVLHAYAQPLAAQTLGPGLGDPPRPPLHEAPSEDTPAAEVPQDVAVLTINSSDWQQVIDAYQEYYLPAQPASGWSGNVTSCNAGTTSDAFREAVIRRVNFFRAMAGVPADVTLSAAYNTQAQQAAMMMSVNNQLNHTPPDSWTCYTEEGLAGASHGNLAMGAYGVQAVDLYMRDPGAGNHFAGHRRWILYPQTLYMGTGDVPNSGGKSAANNLVVIDASQRSTRPGTRDEFVAWPPRGYVPQPLVYARWTFSLAGADFSAAQIRMQSQGADVPLEPAPQAVGFGENTLVWIPMGLNDGANWPAPAGGAQTYQVSVNNVVVKGQTRNFSYTVTVVDPTVKPEIPVGEIVIQGPGFVGTSFPPNAIVAILGPPDPRLASQYSYALGNGTGDADNAKFKIEGAALKTRVALAEAGKTYTVRVEATDGAGAKTASVIPLPTKPTKNVMIPAVSGAK